MSSRLISFTNNASAEVWGAESARHCACRGAGAVQGRCREVQGGAGAVQGGAGGCTICTSASIISGAGRCRRSASGTGTPQCKCRCVLNRDLPPARAMKHMRCCRGQLQQMPPCLTSLLHPTRSSFLGCSRGQGTKQHEQKRREDRHDRSR